MGVIHWQLLKAFDGFFPLVPELFHSHGKKGFKGDKKYHISQINIYKKKEDL